MTNKFYGKLGFCKTEETSPGVWKKNTIERDYYGEYIRGYVKWDQGEKVNPDLKVERTLSVVADNILTEEFFALTYVRDGAYKWRITKIDFAPPRMTLTLGDEYIEEESHDRIEG